MLWVKNKTKSARTNHRRKQCVYSYYEVKREEKTHQVLPNILHYIKYRSIFLQHGETLQFFTNNMATPREFRIEYQFQVQHFLGNIVHASKDHMSQGKDAPFCSITAFQRSHIQHYHTTTLLWNLKHTCFLSFSSSRSAFFIDSTTVFCKA